MDELSANHFLLLSAALFIIGMMGVLTRRNVLVIFMSVELMINAVNVAFVGFAWEQMMVGQTFALSASRDGRHRRFKRTFDRTKNLEDVCTGSTR